MRWKVCQNGELDEGYKRSEVSMLDNSGQYEYLGDDHAVAPKDRKRKGAFLPHIAKWQLRKITGMARNEVPNGIGSALIEMSSEGEIEYALMKHYYKLMGINYEFPNARPPISEEEKKTVLTLREDGLTFKEIGKKIGCDEKTIREIIKDFRKTMEIENDRKHLRVSEEEKKQILALRQEGFSYEKIAEKIGRDDITITKVVEVFEEEGIVSSSEYKKPLSEEQKKEILDLHDQGISYKKIAEKLGISKSSISRVVNFSLSFFSSLTFDKVDLKKLLNQKDLKA